MPSEEEALRALFAEATGRVAAILDAMLKINVETEAQIETTTKTLVVVAAAHHGDITGSRQAPCENCGQKVWLGPMSQKKLAARGSLPSKIVCIPCFIAITKKGAEEHA